MAAAFEIIDIVHVKLAEKKHTLKYGSFEQMETVQSMKELQENVEEVCSKMIGKFYESTLMVLSSSGDHETLRQLVEQRGDVSAKVSQLKQEFGLQTQENEQAFFVACCEVIALAMNSEFEGFAASKKEKFEECLVPSEVFKNLVLIMQSADSETSSVKVLCASTKIMWRLTQLDLHPDFAFVSERDNPYFKEACNYFSLYVK